MFKNFTLQHSTIIVVVLLLVSIIVTAFFIWPQKVNAPKQVVCTAEAKLCPDGSAVGRIGPNCEFADCAENLAEEITVYCVASNCAPEQLTAGAGTLIQGCFHDLADCTGAPTVCTNGNCPGVVSSTPWLTFKDVKQQLEFQYPAKLPTDYIQAVAWPPTVSSTVGELSCKESVDDSAAFEQVATKIINKQTYCVKTLVEGAAGSINSTSNYATEKAGKLINVSLTLRSVQCDNYDEPQKTVCKQERTSFDLDSIITKIIDSIKYD